MRYHYIALSQDSRELSGIIEAADEPQARVKLNELGMSVVSLTVVNEDVPLVAKNAGEPGTKVASPLFEFEAFDQNNKKVVGTIAAQDDLRAFTRLLNEYRLSVYYIANSTLDSASKKKARTLGTAELQTRYDKEKTVSNTPKSSMLSLQSNDKNNQAAAADEAAKNEAEKNQLVKIVDETIARINVFLQTNGALIKQEERDIITSDINQLLRIKDSSNLEHTKATCEKMLSHIQKQELFINEREKIKESAQLKLETSKLLDELNAGSLQKSIYINDIISKWAKNPLFKYIASIFQTWFPPLTDVMRDKKAQIATTQSHIVTYTKTLIFGSSTALRAEAWESIKSLRTQKKRLQLEFKALVYEESRIFEAHSQIDKKQDSMAYGSLSGFLMSFYLVTYFLSFPFTIKKNPLSATFPDSIFFYGTTYIKALTLVLFMYYCVKTFFSQNPRYNNAVAKSIGSVLAAACYLLIAVNLF